jgi:hypothetical protein
MERIDLIVMTDGCEPSMAVLDYFNRNIGIINQCGITINISAFGKGDLTKTAISSLKKNGIKSFPSISFNNMVISGHKKIINVIKNKCRLKKSKSGGMGFGCSPEDQWLEMCGKTMSMEQKDIDDRDEHNNDDDIVARATAVTAARTAAHEKRFGAPQKQPIKKMPGKPTGKQDKKKKMTHANNIRVTKTGSPEDAMQAQLLGKFLDPDDNAY